MKRSEMVAKIKKEMVDHFLSCDRITRELCERAADRALEITEEEGMLPPLIQLSHINAKDNAWDPES